MSRETLLKVLAWDRLPRCSILCVALGMAVCGGNTVLRGCLATFLTRELCALVVVGLSCIMCVLCTTAMLLVTLSILLRKRDMNMTAALDVVSWCIALMSVWALATDRCVAGLLTMTMCVLCVRVCRTLIPRRLLTWRVFMRMAVGILTLACVMRLLKCV